MPKSTRAWREFLWNMYSDGKTVQCCHCSEDMGYNEFTQEHLLPRSKGGRNHAFNLLPACKRCNNGRACEDISDKFADYIAGKLNCEKWHRKVHRVHAKSYPKHKETLLNPVLRVDPEPVVEEQEEPTANEVISQLEKAFLAHERKRLQGCKRKKKQPRPNVWHYPNPSFFFHA